MSSESKYLNAQYEGFFEHGLSKTDPELFKAIKDESDLSLPPLIIETFFGYFCLICFLSLTTKIIFLKSKRIDSNQ